MDGDGVKDIITGKRWFSHGMEYPENDRDDPAVMAWFKTVRKSGGAVEFVPHIINNYAGLGTQIKVADMNNDKRPGRADGGAQGRVHLPQREVTFPATTGFPATSCRETRFLSGPSP